MGRKKGTKITEEHRQNIVNARKGVEHSDETKAKMAESHRRRISLSKEDYDWLISYAILNNITVKKCLSDTIKFAIKNYARYDYV